MPDILLDRRRHQDRPMLTVTGDIALPLGRLHEVCGRARRSFAAMIAARTKGPVIWIAPTWEPDQLNPQGLHAFVDPGRFLFITPKRPDDILWSLEEVLRSGAVALAVADLPGLPGLTAVRRLHLAAEAGATHAHTPPLGVILTPGGGGAQGVETRWQMTPAHQPARPGWRLDRLRARMAPPRGWDLHLPPDSQLPVPLEAATNSPGGQKRPAPVE